ncbi:SURF1 family cytochrome oxidase biogenesis protein [Altererythrobacter sp. H2]|uniref:SURF1 family protein n=1 Tax=Altererythrobacter sp. H2 TaxID=3108391 RepID=UPI000BD674B1|nr:SURF1 family cytochrome oxidase biogenesis protein [Altererythrobacter sp. H2]OZA94345.1 MAG: threonine synthase [Erythrobacter sp. 34-65-8]WRK97167.1 SURF1 family cytochrome oxidase biogenesis protein [Altererythrobacter sp. H2]
MRKIPIVPTLVVLLAVAIMIALGVWQLGRAEEKDALLQRYAAAGASTDAVAWPINGDAAERVLYRRSRITCESLSAMKQVAGTAASGARGWAHRATCTLPGGEASALVDIGWSAVPNPAAWTGGQVSGIMAPGPRLVADPPLAGLEPLARPDPRELPNNHLSYAVQWFLFALTALVIYGIALRRRWRDRS